MEQSQQIIITIFYATLADLRRRLVTEARDFKQMVLTRPRLPLRLLREHGRALVARQILALSEYELMANLIYNELKAEFHVLPWNVKRKTTSTWLFSSNLLNSLQPRLLRLERGHPATKQERLAHWQSTRGAFNCSIKAFKKFAACAKTLISCHQAIMPHLTSQGPPEDDEFIGLRCMRV